MRRERRFDTFQEAQKRGSYDEFPMLELGVDPQLHLSRNTVRQPFFLICEKDTMVATLSGRARIEFHDASVNYFDVELGDYVYVPGGTPHRIVPAEETIQLRYKAQHAGLEAVAWYGSDGREISRVTWDCATEIPQAAYLRACEAFNADPAKRTSRSTGEVLAPIDLAPFRWREIAAEVAEIEAAERANPPRDFKIEAPHPQAVTLIPPPDGSRPPMKSNVYWFTRAATTALNPLFPFTEPGTMVPCATILDPATKGYPGYFIHANTVHEVNVSFGTRGGQMIPGGVSVGQFKHPVGQKRDQAHSDTINIALITQRQAESGVQRESFVLLCDECKTTLHEHDYDAHEFPEPLPGEASRALVGLPTLSQDALAVARYNADPAMRTCPKCGHVSEPFPIDYWGWEEYRRRTHVVVEARETMKNAVAAAAAAHA